MFAKLLILKQTWLSNSRLAFWGKTFLVGALCWALYIQLKAPASGWYFLLAKLLSSQWPWLIGVFVLMPLNWCLEALKWRTLMKLNAAQLPLWPAFKAVAAGVAFSQLTPNRVGEYGGRLLLLAPQHRWNAVTATLLGSIAQWIALLSGGLAGLSFWAAQYWHWSAWQLTQALGLAGAVILLLGLVYFKSGYVVERLSGLLAGSRFDAWVKRFGNWTQLDTKMLSYALAWAFARYGVYAFQYIILLHVFVPNLPWPLATAGVAVVFLLQTGLPLPPIAAALARSEIALWVWAPFAQEPLALVAAGWVLFIINIGIPALLGTTIIVQTSVLKLFAYENDSV